ncbi:hypothetical protein TRICHSKD4_4550 [Roseibium sp. TrichSKD4]|uniref:hypothetical protein n=1 Tax=Roseibium sp. TrichSKD4 TaxID=744980 RepID=UPI0001E5760F|nr:hypothetical protein [Roseibium sp. TrichSKD4]EFO30950.1 hypothetical protein TRICHSKD4_4550 [Roseibium sp. TrichSKD4]
MVDACGGFTPVYPTEREVSQLSQQTVDGLLANLETGRAECGWVPPNREKVQGRVPKSDREIVPAIIPVPRRKPASAEG